jgi:hypothetical protein
MSQWHLAKIAAVALTLATSACPERRALSDTDTSRGPVSEEEGNILWQDGQSDASGGLCADAVPLLKRLVDRYPGHPGYVKAHLLLGECLIQLDDPSAAVAQLRYFTQGSASEANPESHDLYQRGRVALGRAYLALGRGSEADLVASEIARHASPSGPAELYAVEGLLIRARALVLLGQDERAQDTLDSVTPLIPAGHTDLSGQAAWTKMRLVNRRCSRLLAKGSLDEAQARNQLGRRGDCMLEATVAARDALLTGQASWARRVEQQAIEALGSFEDACRKAPSPPKRSKRTPTELKKYRAELAQVMARDCARTVQGAITMLDGWKKEMPAQSAPYLLGIRSAFADALAQAKEGAKP